jgi:hypothetical protein
MATGFPSVVIPAFASRTSTPSPARHETIKVSSGMQRITIEPNIGDSAGQRDAERHVGVAQSRQSVTCEGS